MVGFDIREVIFVFLKRGLLDKWIYSFGMYKDFYEKSYRYFEEC